MDHPPEGHDPNTVHMPAPTAWPMICAFGLTLTCAGFVTSPVIGIVGFVLLVTAAVGWWFDVLPEEKAEYVPMLPESERVAAVEPLEGRVRHLKLGQGGHRVRIPVVYTPYGIGFWAGIVGAGVMAAMAVGYGVFWYGSPWYPINLLAAAGVDEMQDAKLPTLLLFNLHAFVVACGAHLALSVSIGLLYAVLLPMFPKFAKVSAIFIVPLIWSGLVGGTLWYVNPLMNKLVDWPYFILCQFAFGAVVGWVVSFEAPIETMQTWPLAMRAGLETPPDPTDSGETSKESKP